MLPKPRAAGGRPGEGRSACPSESGLSPVPSPGLTEAPRAVGGAEVGGGQSRRRRCRVKPCPTSHPRPFLTTASERALMRLRPLDSEPAAGTHRNQGGHEAAPSCDAELRLTRRPAGSAELGTASSVSRSDTGNVDLTRGPAGRALPIEPRRDALHAAGAQCVQGEKPETKAGGRDRRCQRLGLAG